MSTRNSDITFEATLDTRAGNQVLLITAQPCDTRLLATYIYLISAELENHSKKLDVSWKIQPNAEKGQIVVQTNNVEEEERAMVMISGVMRSYGGVKHHAATTF